MKIVGENLVNEFWQGMSIIPYLYGVRVWLPKDSNSADIAKYISMRYPYQVRARENGINSLGEELPTLTISAHKIFGKEGIFHDIASNEMAKMLINSFQKAEQHMADLRSVRFWLPLSTNLCGNSEEVVAYINQNYSDYQAHKKDTIQTPQDIHLPSLVIGSKNIIK